MAKFLKSTKYAQEPDWPIAGVQNYRSNMKEARERGLAARKLLYTTVFSQCFSPCGKFLAAANNFGYIAVFSLEAALAPAATDISKNPIYTFKASEDGSINCLISTDTLIISASYGTISAWKWSDVLSRASKVLWTLTIPKRQPFFTPEVNSIYINSQEDMANHLFAGCGDNNIHVWDIETGQEVHCLQGHTDYVHAITKKSDNECASASEDGTVRIWDCRSAGEASLILQPFKHEACARPEFGKWVGCVGVDSGNDWLICGGGPRMSAWYLRSLTMSTTFDTPGACQQFIMFNEDTVISAGTEAFVNHWYMNGDCKSRVPCTPTSVFSVAINRESETNRVLCVAGSSATIDVCTNFGYKAFGLSFTIPD
ncbi:hypothetical protein ACJMK2_011743 [Sinanodonta woodiana]|uniref:THO complex subunit 6 n=1 Tax=Sinanodonta woodiana TaxID=1069815 RepID=A0ABD3V5N7_SINWO